MSNQKNITMKFSDVDAKLINIESVKMGKDEVPLLRYGPEKKTLIIQGPWIKMKQYGLPPGELLSNGIKNEYYKDEESRKSLRVPIDKACCVQSNPKDPESATNEDDIVEFLEKLKQIDSHVKNSKDFLKASKIEDDDKEKYVPIYRKPSKPKKPTKEPKEKYYSMKLKFDIENESGDIKTEFIYINGDTNEKQVMNNESGKISIQDLEKLITYNCEVLPLFQVVKIWTQSTGAWGITLKLKKCRVRKYSYARDNSAEFLDSDDESEVPTKTVKTLSSASASVSASASASASAAASTVASTKPLEVAEVKSDSDQESDDGYVKPITSKTSTTSRVVKQINSDNESDDDPKPVKLTKPATTKAVGKKK